MMEWMERIKVLLVDDEEELSLVMAERLQLRGFDAEGVTSGEEALERLLEKAFDVAVIDIKMPGIGGLDLMKEIQKKHPDTKVILFTGHGSGAEEEGQDIEGAVDYLVKPVDIDDLTEKIRLAAEA